MDDRREPDLRAILDDAAKAVVSGLGSAADGLRTLADRLEQPREGQRFGRLDYTAGGLAESDLTDEPMALFERWYAEAQDAEREANAMVLGTVGHGRPSSRTVLLKGLDGGWRFFTNYDSRKGDELAGNPACSLLFPWYALERQVRVEGVAERLPREDSEAYFATRPRDSQLGAWASVDPAPQSAVVADRDALQAAYDAAQARFADADVPCPPTWGGYVVRPEAVEFWQGRHGRVHDRLRYRREETGWVTERLAP
ncbi:pyridoxamine 5'-phosphate oxidase [Nocardioides mangrovicus]|uniref:Pyridoxine/pyridoxamine 5'-phosphate oxidase n=1 Tax=Nocardioides mangrovicus TaxID=2478913 RepID=A0A3L8NXB9_9ACTN|nr:pyridoxamine 5'-phosphate oxidase [Nocardioides mangrovicus]RLV47491.1 pyridoxamine 5'-phosphate oxidase [Nocardioides mangrovicus]